MQGPRLPRDCPLLKLSQAGRPPSAGHTHALTTLWRCAVPMEGAEWVLEHSRDPSAHDITSQLPGHSQSPDSQQPKPDTCVLHICVCVFFKDFIYSFMRNTQRETGGRDTGRGRSRLHAPGARRWIRPRVSRITPWAKGRRQTIAPPRDPRISAFIFCKFVLKG